MQCITRGGHRDTAGAGNLIPSFLTRLSLSRSHPLSLSPLDLQKVPESHPQNSFLSLRGIPRLWGLGGFGVMLIASHSEGERRGLSHPTLLAIKQQNPFSEQFVAINSHSQE